MERNAAVSEVQRGVNSFAGFHHLKRIDEHNVTPNRLRWLWERMQECEYAFDDFTQGKTEYFLHEFANASNEFYEMSDSGLVILSNITEEGGSRIHYLMWDHDFVLSKSVAREAFDYLFYKRKVHHIVGMIPQHNQMAVRFAISVGMRFEGEIREDVLYKGRYYSTHVYGLLEQEYPSRRARLA